MPAVNMSRCIPLTSHRMEDAGDELDPLADDCAGFLQDQIGCLTPKRVFHQAHVIADSSSVQVVLFTPNILP